MNARYYLHCQDLVFLFVMTELNHLSSLLLTLLYFFHAHSTTTKAQWTTCLHFLLLFVCLSVCQLSM
ncbi:hypothetical protein F5H01DRAFT_341988 [Linnemannia elongata]|nr:hypothetical protein F5H01DRAFT_341988 [Linnemannia elongata]